MDKRLCLRLHCQHVVFLRGLASRVNFFLAAGLDLSKHFALLLHSIQNIHEFSIDVETPGLGLHSPLVTVSVAFESYSLGLLSQFLYELATGVTVFDFFSGNFELLGQCCCDDCHWESWILR